MTTKTYDQLAPQTQQVIDSVIFLAEAKSIAHDVPLPKNLAQRVADSRALYAEDIQRETPQFHEWRESGARYVQQAGKLREEVLQAGDTHPEFTDLATLLTNLTSKQPAAERSATGRG